MVTNVLKYKSAQAVCYEHDGAFLGLGSLAKLCQCVGEVDGMVPDAVLVRGAPEMGNVGVISKGNNTSVGNINFEKMSWPEDAGRLVCPSRLAVACQTMEEYNAGGR